MGYTRDWVSKTTARNLGFKWTDRDSRADALVRCRERQLVEPGSDPSQGSILPLDYRPVNLRNNQHHLKNFLPKH